MSILQKFDDLYQDIKAYANAAGKDIEDVFLEIKDFLGKKRFEASVGNAAGASAGAAANLTPASGVSATDANPATAGTNP